MNLIDNMKYFRELVRDIVQEELAARSCACCAKNDELEALKNAREIMNDPSGVYTPDDFDNASCDQELGETMRRFREYLDGITKIKKDKSCKQL